MDGIRADMTLDEEGLVWPVFMLKARKSIETMTSGQVLEVVLSSPDLVGRMPELVGRLGHEVVLSRAEEGNHYFYVRKS
jgi:tRNA 2-thiouridine synthesizing protein A